MMKKITNLLIFTLASFSMSGQAQEILPVNHLDGGIVFEKTVCISDEQRAMMQAKAESNRKELVKKGVLPETPDNKMLVSLDWPVRQAAGFNDPGYYGISNFVDQNANYPNQLLDHNCGARTYDLASGYNHAGVDIFTWPFGWAKMDDGHVEVIAAAAGVIIEKTDGEYDKNCSFCSNCDPNYIIIEHSDGSFAFYLHMKNGSVTPKTVGQMVAQGEYLGVVGSSGFSTGPHLHFEIWAGSTFSTLQDPYSGPCNTLNATSWWADQKPYRESRINKIMTHSAAPQSNTCYPDVVNAANTFAPGGIAYFGTYLQDERLNHTKNLKIYKPDNSVWQSWTHTPNAGSSNYYDASWWYWWWTLPSNGPAGIWKFELTYQGQTVSHNFFVTGPSVCVSNLVINSEPIPSFEYKSEGALTSFSSLVPDGGVVSFKSDTEIWIPSNFTVEEGGVFNAEIQGCSSIADPAGATNN